MCTCTITKKYQEHMHKIAHLQTMFQSKPEILASRCNDLFGQNHHHTPMKSPLLSPLLDGERTRRTLGVLMARPWPTWMQHLPQPAATRRGCRACRSPGRTTAPRRARHLQLVTTSHGFIWEGFRFGGKPGYIYIYIYNI